MSAPRRFAQAIASPTVLTWVLAPAAIVLLSWRVVNILPVGGLDGSWEGGLYMAIHRGFSFGDHAIFTYGPLGFLTTNGLWYADLGLAAFAYHVVVLYGLALAVFLSARRNVGAVIAFLFTLVVVGLPVEAEPVIALIAFAWVFEGEVSRQRTLGIAAAGGAFAGAELLVKISVGAAIAVMLVVFLASIPLGRGELVAAAACGFLLTFVGGWLITSQRITELPDFISNSWQIASGYAPAMGVSAAAFTWQWIAVVTGLVIGLWGALRSSELAPTRARAGLAGLWIAFWFFAFKEGFVRHDDSHGSLGVATIGVGLVAFRWILGTRAVVLLVTTAMITFALAGLGRRVSYVFNPVSDAHVALREIEDVLSPSTRARITVDARNGIRTDDHLDARALQLLHDRTTAIYPSEVAMAWAYGLDWDPLPVWQSYSAYTSKLDDLGASFLSSARAPQRIVMQPQPAIDGRLLSFDQPSTNRTILCRYRQLYVTGKLAVLGLSGDRCGAPRLLEKVHADWRHTVQVPAPPDGHSLVFVRVSGSGAGGLEQLRSLLYKPAQRYVELNGAHYFRLVTGTADDGLPLQAPAGYDFTSPFNITAQASSIAVEKLGSGSGGGEPLTFSFYSLPFSAKAS